MRFGLPFVFASTVVLAAALPLACGGAGSGQTGSATTHGAGGHATSSTSGDQGGNDLFNDGGSDPVVSVTITPADPAMEVLNGAIPAPVSFTAVGKTQGGSMVDLAGTWTFDRPDVGTLNSGSGVFTATGLTGGKGTVTFTSGSLTATTTATVKLHFTSDPMMVDPSTKMQFGQASAADPAMTMLYPYDKTVFPRGLTGPTLQWNGGGPADIYYVHASCPTFELEAWTTVPPPSRYVFDLMPTDIWKKLTDSTSGDITVNVQRHDGSQPYLPVTRTWTIAPAVLTGTIYYWAVNAGNVMRLQPGGGAAAPFLQTPPANPVDVTCIACHSVSKSGNRIVAAFNGNASPWGSFDTATGNTIFTYGTDPNNGGNGSGFEAISPDGSVVLWGQSRQLPYLSLNPYNGPGELAQLNPGVGAPVYPAWSGDGAHVAFSVRTDGNWLDFDNATLWTTDVDLSTNTFANTHMIVDNANQPSATVYPTYSPDSKWVSFERCNHSRSRGNLGDVWLVQGDGSNAVSLDNANGTGLLQGNEVSSTYEPTFLPVAVGGYFWLVVVSERTYGNTLTDTGLASRYKQLWVTAVDANPMPGQDPSHPAFWLPGQDLTTNNMRGEWALSPCKMVGDTCTAGYDCCGGFCHDDGMGNLTCSATGGTCSLIGEACKTGADCCDPAASCIGGFCANNVPH